MRVTDRTSGSLFSYVDLEEYITASRPLKKDLEEHLSSTSSMLDPNTFPQLDESAQKTRLIWHKGSDGGLFQQPARHPLRKIRQVVDDALASLVGEFAPLYADFGRTSISDLQH
ncbi:hypothetical protein SAMN05444339_12025 [Loktanella atrilutea]|uniref:Uncharacterized protein n=1 Tax=Loktanella atrilutea TaxID=366533 RepID=A0A1M5FF13_LOKAT|nr:hypothetical protein SAMN05444339_12025 [Loktanella atrilutea]